VFLFMYTVWQMSRDVDRSNDGNVGAERERPQAGPICRRRRAR
jgi:hypothetical protein